MVDAGGALYQDGWRKVEDFDDMFIMHSAMARRRLGICIIQQGDLRDVAEDRSVSPVHDKW